MRLGACLRASSISPGRRARRRGIPQPDPRRACAAEAATSIAPASYKENVAKRITSRCWVAAALVCGPGLAGAQSPGGGAAPTPEVTSERLLRAADEPGSWMMYGGSYWQQRYTKSNKINARNVGQLVPRMVFQTGISKLGSFENTPIVVDGRMYVTTPYNTVMAYDLKTRK